MMNQQLPVADAMYKARCLRKLKELDLPTKDWFCEWVEDTDEPESVCELCGCSRVRFLHYMRHPLAPATIAVGCLCDGVMSGDELGALERERDARNRAKRRENFVHGVWIRTWHSGTSNRWEKKMRNGPLCIIRQDAQGRYFVWHKGRWCGRYKGKPIATFEQAASALFTVNDPKRNTV